MTECPRCRTRYKSHERFCSHDGERLAPVPELLGMLGPEALLNRTVDHRYFMQATIGRGGMGTVYKAEHVKLRTTVALKVLHPHLALRPVVLARFEREARAASKIGHPNIVQVYDMGEIPDIGAPYFAMECLKGESLKDVFLRQRTLHLDQILPITRQICAALHAAHDGGIVHRDLKPANIFMVGRDPKNAVVKVLDFGVSKLVERDPDQPTLTATGVILGTPGYMAPEQADGRPVDERSDIYSLGVILYRALSGTVPFKAANMVLLLQRIVEEPPMPPSLRAPDREIPLQLEEVVLHALQKDPDRRPQSAADLMTELEQAMREIGGDTRSTSIDLVPYGVLAAGDDTRAMGSRPKRALRRDPREEPDMPRPAFGPRVVTDAETRTDTMPSRVGAPAPAPSGSHPAPPVHDLDAPVGEGTTTQRSGALGPSGPIPDDDEDDED